MKRYYSVWCSFIVCSFALFVIHPLLSKIGRCALEPSMEKIKISSPAFKGCCPIPNKHIYTQCGGQNKSPELTWQNVPQGAKSYILLVEDPDAPSSKNPRKNPWVHWLVYDLPSNIKHLASGVSMSSLGAKEGKNDFGNNKYDGPCPPAGSWRHRYFFKIKALDIPSLGLSQGATKEQILEKARCHIIAEGECIGTYEICAPATR